MYFNTTFSTLLCCYILQHCGLCLLSYNTTYICSTLVFFVVLYYNVMRCISCVIIQRNARVLGPQKSGSVACVRACIVY